MIWGPADFAPVCLWCPLAFRLSCPHLQALHNGTLSFGFSAGGCLFPYYIGVAGGLMDAGILTADVKLGGASAGSLLATCIKSGMTLDAIVEQNQRLMADLRQGGTRGRMGPVLRAFLDANLPEDAHIACSGKAYVSVRC